MLVRPEQPSARRAVHLTITPEFGPFRNINGLRLIPLADLIRMQLTSFRLWDETCLKDLAEAGLISAEIETGISPTLRERLAQVRERE